MPNENLHSIELVLREIQITLKNQDARLAEHMDAAKNREAKFDLLMNGTAESPGILTRLDRTEQTLKSYSRLLWIVIGAVVTQVVVGVSAGIVIVAKVGLLHP